IFSHARSLSLSQGAKTTKKTSFSTVGRDGAFVTLQFACNVPETSTITQQAPTFAASRRTHGPMLRTLVRNSSLKSRLSLILGALRVFSRDRFYIIFRIIGRLFSKQQWSPLYYLDADYHK
ncbi:MAG: hypothetical protein U9Q94_00605, partial [Candidatus Bipolaricaulota bacterium]|nr:hypothetical protein [Candidatus Bipolaricaulota bacterium]